jgi:hypothetical protein
MRKTLMFLAICCLASCGGPAKKNADGLVGCEAAARSTLTFTDPARPDTVEARAFGPSCANATMVLTVRNSEGAILHTTAQPMAAAGLGAGPISPEQAMTILQAWVALKVEKSSAAPEWMTGELRPQPPGPDALAESDLIRAMYEDIRKQDVAMACYARGLKSKTCLFSRQSPDGPVVGELYHVHAD